jgi:hypothetical protein
MMIKRPSIRRALGAMLTLGLVVTTTGMLPGSAGAQSPSQLSKPDLYVTVLPTGSDCNTVRFELGFIPKANPTRGTYDVNVRVIDWISGRQTVAWERRFTMDASSAAKLQATADFSLPADHRFDPDFENVLKVVVDPDQEIAERNEFNNFSAIRRTCSGEDAAPGGRTRGGSTG